MLNSAGMMQNLTVLITYFVATSIAAAQTVERFCATRPESFLDLKYVAGKMVDTTSADLQSRISENCQKQRELFLGGFRNQISPEKLVSEISKNNPNLIILGESHGQNTKDLYLRLISSLKKKFPDLDCLILEWPPVPKDLYDRISSHPENIPPEYQKALGTDYRAFPIREAAHLKMKVLFAETPNNTTKFEPGEPQTPAYRDLRDRLAAENIQEWLLDPKKAKCHRAVQIVGAYHITDREPRTPIPAILEINSKMRTSKIRILSGGSGDMNHPDQSWLWQTSVPLRGEDNTICPTVPGFPEKTFAFVVPKSPGDGVAHFYDRFGFSGSWNSFDGAIVLGCMEDNPDGCVKLKKMKFPQPYLTSDEAR